MHESPTLRVGFRALGSRVPQTDSALSNRRALRLQWIPVRWPTRRCAVPGVEPDFVLFRKFRIETHTQTHTSEESHVWPPRRASAFPPSHLTTRMEAVQNGHPPLRTRKDRLRSEGKNLRIQPRTPRRRPQKPRSMKTNNGALKRSREDVKEAIEVSFDFGVPYVVTLKKGVFGKITFISQGPEYFVPHFATPTCSSLTLTSSRRLHPTLEPNTTGRMPSCQTAKKGYIGTMRGVMRPA